MVKVNDKIVLVSRIGMFNNIGEIYDVVKVDDEFIYFSFGDEMRIGGITHNQFDKYFEIYEEPVKNASINDIMEKCELINTWAFNIACTITELQNELNAMREIKVEEEEEFIPNFNDIKTNKEHKTTFVINDAEEFLKNMFR